MSGKARQQAGLTAHTYSRGIGEMKRRGKKREVPKRTPAEAAIRIIGKVLDQGVSAAA